MLLAAINHLGGIIDQQPRRLNLRRHVRQHKLNPLVLSNRLVKLHALFSIGYRQVKRPLRNTQRLRANPNARLIQRRQRDFKAITFSPQQILSGHFTVHENQFGGLRALDTHFFLDPSHGKPGKIPLHNKSADPPCSGLRVRDSKDRVDLRQSAIRNKAFGAVKNIRISLAHSPCLHRRCVGP